MNWNRALGTLALAAGCSQSPVAIVYSPKEMMPGEILHTKRELIENYHRDAASENRRRNEEYTRALLPATTRSIRTETSDTSPPSTMLAAFGSTAKRIEVYYFHESWGRFSNVKKHIRRILVAAPYGGALVAGPLWSEGVPTSVFATIEFNDGQRRPLRFGKGYLYFQDQMGKGWWGKYPIVD